MSLQATDAKSAKDFIDVFTSAYGAVDKTLIDGTDLFLQTDAGTAVENWYQRLGFKIQFTGRFYAIPAQ